MADFTWPIVSIGILALLILIPVLSFGKYSKTRRLDFRWVMRELGS